MSTDSTEKDINDLMFGNSTPVFNWDVEPARIRGRIVKIEKSHRRAFDGKTKTQGEPLYWSSAGKLTTEETDRPVYDPVLHLETAYRKWEGVGTPGDDGDDTGVRRLFVTARSKQNPGSIKDAVVAACVKAKSKLHVGDFVEVERYAGKGNLNSPYKHRGQYFTADAAPEWASELITEDTAPKGEDDLFDE